MKLHELSAVELSEKIKNSDITSEEVTKVFLDRINSIDEKTAIVRMKHTAVSCKVRTFFKRN